jgi:putative transposase
MNTLCLNPLLKKYIHIVFSTKHRQPLISSPFENEIHSYLAGTCKRLECNPIIAGGHTDHVHILCLLSKKNIIGKIDDRIKGTFIEVDQNKR